VPNSALGALEVDGNGHSGGLIDAYVHKSVWVWCKISSVRAQPVPLSDARKLRNARDSV
jgi:hypothetical protein